MSEILEQVGEAIMSHWVKLVVGLGLMSAGWLIGRWRATKRFERKEFFERINFSLNSIVDGTLRIRTIMEKKCDDVFLNQVAVSRLLESAQQTTEDDPIIPLPVDEYWFYLNSVLNEVSEKFAAGFVQRDAGREVRAQRYIICLTNECDGAIRTRKLRAMLILEKDLKSLPEEMPRLDSKNHATRWRTLQKMAAGLDAAPHQYVSVELFV